MADRWASSAILRYDLGSTSVRPSWLATASTAAWAAGKSDSVAARALDLGEITEALGPVERNFDLVKLFSQMECRSRLANRGDWLKAEVGEQSRQLTERLITLGEGNLDFLAGLGWAASAAGLCR